MIDKTIRWCNIYRVGDINGYNTIITHARNAYVSDYENVLKNNTLQVVVNNRYKISDFQYKAIKNRKNML